jgi:hypothetical protein
MGDEEVRREGLSWVEDGLLSCTRTRLLKRIKSAISPASRVRPASRCSCFDLRMDKGSSPCVAPLSSLHPVTTSASPPFLPARLLLVHLVRERVRVHPSRPPPVLCIWPPNTCTHRQLPRVTARTLAPPARCRSRSLLHRPRTAPVLRLPTHACLFSLLLLHPCA